MDRGVYAIVSGAVGQERRLDVVAKNLANAQTAGYKREKTVFQTIFAKSLMGGAKIKSQADKAFNRLGNTYLDWRVGPHRPTGHPTDLALEGEGFFVVKTARGNEYTRSGNFILNDKRQLTTQDGALVLGQSGPFEVPPGKLLVDAQGGLSVNEATVDTLRLVKFKEAASAVRVGDRFTTNGATDPVPSTKVIQGGLEESNVNAIEEFVALVEISRQYEAAQKVVQAMDETTHLAVSEIAKPV
jgi:flagellar basal-body rod protein FlgF